MSENREDNINDMSNSQSMVLSDILPNDSKVFWEDLAAFRYSWIIPVPHDVFCTCCNYCLKS